ncbi:MAG: hypothetical protein WCG06_07080, partial [Candidatus Omnitrophota bacterium]
MRFAKRQKRLGKTGRGRRLALESLETRQLLSGPPTTFLTQTDQARGAGNSPVSVMLSAGDRTQPGDALRLSEPTSDADLRAHTVSTDLYLGKQPEPLLEDALLEDLLRPSTTISATDEFFSSTQSTSRPADESKSPTYRQRREFLAGLLKRPGAVLECGQELLDYVNNHFQSLNPGSRPVSRRSLRDDFRALTGVAIREFQIGSSKPLFVVRRDLIADAGSARDQKTLLEALSVKSKDGIIDLPKAKEGQKTRLTSAKKAFETLHKAALKTLFAADEAVPEEKTRVAAQAKQAPSASGLVLPDAADFIKSSDFKITSADANGKPVGDDLVIRVRREAIVRLLDKYRQVLGTDFDRASAEIFLNFDNYYPDQLHLQSSLGMFSLKRLREMIAESRTSFSGDDYLTITMPRAHIDIRGGG